MNLLRLLNNPIVGIVIDLVEPFILKLINKNVPKRITNLYQKMANFIQPVEDSLLKLKNKIDLTPNELDDECLKIGVGALKALNQHLSELIEKLEK